MTSFISKKNTKQILMSMLMLGAFGVSGAHGFDQNINSAQGVNNQKTLGDVIEKHEQALMK
jgi:hypothetical protein